VLDSPPAPAASGEPPRPAPAAGPYAWPPAEILRPGAMPLPKWQSQTAAAQRVQEGKATRPRGRRAVRGHRADAWRPMRPKAIATGSTAGGRADPEGEARRALEMSLPRGRIRQLRAGYGRDRPPNMSTASCNSPSGTRARLRESGFLAPREQYEGVARASVGKKKHRAVSVKAVRDQKITSGRRYGLRHIGSGEDQRTPCLSVMNGRQAPELGKKKQRPAPGRNLRAAKVMHHEAKRKNSRTVGTIDERMAEGPDRVQRRMGSEARPTRTR